MVYFRPDLMDTSILKLASLGVSNYLSFRICGYIRFVRTIGFSIYIWILCIVKYCTPKRLLYFTLLYFTTILIWTTVLWALKCHHIDGRAAEMKLAFTALLKMTWVMVVKHLEMWYGDYARKWRESAFRGQLIVSANLRDCGQLFVIQKVRSKKICDST